MADVHGSNVCVSTHFGKKDDDVGTYLLTIADIKTKIGYDEPGHCLESGLMECGGMTFKLKVFPNGVNEVVNDGQGGRLAMTITVIKHGNTQWKKMKTLVAKNPDGNFLTTYSNLLDRETLQTNRAFLNGVKYRTLLTHATILAEENASFFPNGVLTVEVNITVQGEETVSHRTKVPDDSITPFQLKGELSEHLKKMLESHQFTDLEIICQGAIIPCHRSMLAARSGIFEAMFRHDPEKKELVIVDFDLDIVKTVVLHIYTGEVELTEENTEQLIKAADYYQLIGLKKKTEDALIKTVKIGNAISMFVLGDAVHANNLRDVSKEVIVSNAVAIVKIDGWKAALGRFPNLGMEILEFVVNGKDRIK